MHESTRFHFHRLPYEYRELVSPGNVGSHNTGVRNWRGFRDVVDAWYNTWPRDFEFAGLLECHVGSEEP